MTRWLDQSSASRAAIPEWPDQSRREARGDDHRLRDALARAIEGGWTIESIDQDLYHNDPVFHAVVYIIRRAIDNATIPATLDTAE